tara:strand:- start:2696 stop:3601 length:906 start_codon:yes stop_codon:yes gene_type:complete
MSSLVTNNNNKVAILCLDYDGCSNVILSENYYEDYKKYYGEQIIRSQNALIDWIDNIGNEYDKVVITCGSNRQSIRFDKNVPGGRRALGSKGDFEKMPIFFNSRRKDDKNPFSLNKLLLPDLIYDNKIGTAWSGDGDYLKLDQEMSDNRDKSPPSIYEKNYINCTIKWKNQILFNQFVHLNELAPEASKIDIYFVDDCPPQDFGLRDFEYYQNELFKNIYNGKKTNEIYKNEKIDRLQVINFEKEYEMPDLHNVTLHLMCFDHYKNIKEDVKKINCVIEKYKIFEQKAEDTEDKSQLKLKF